MNEPLQGNFDGIGVSFNMLTDTVYNGGNFGIHPESRDYAW